MNIKALAITSLALASLLLPSCSVATMKVDPALAARAEAMQVTGANPRLWNRPLAFGPYSTEQVREGGEWRWAISLLGGEAGIAWKNYRLVLTDGTQRIQTACRTRRVFVERDGWSVDPSFGHLPLLQCALRDEDGGEPWTVTLRATARNTITGTIERSGETIRLVSEHRADGAIADTMEPVGYTLSSDGSTIAAVETINRGRVWIDPSVEPSERLAVASAAAALLLFDPHEEP